MFLFIFLLFAMGQLGRLSFANQAINLYLYEIPLVLVVTFWIFKYRLKPFSSQNTWIKSILYFFAWLLFSLLISIPYYNLSQNIEAFLYFARLTFYFLFLTYGILAVKKLKGVAYVTLAIGLISLAQYVFYPNLRNLSYLGWDPHEFRAFGLFFDVSIAGALYGLIFISTLLHKFRDRWIRYGHYFLFGALILLTYSRGLYISLFFTLSCYFFFNKKIKLIAFMVGIFMLAFFILPKQFGEGVNLARTFSITSRIADDKEALSTAAQNPFFGIGYNHIRAVKEDLNPETGQDVSHAGASYHSSFLVILVTSGVIGLLLLIYMLFNIAGISTLSRYALIFLSTYSLFDNILLHPFVLFLLFSLIIFRRK